LIRKVKLIKKPKFDLTKLMELYQERPEVERKEKVEEKEKEGERKEGKEKCLLLIIWLRPWLPRPRPAL